MTLDSDGLLPDYLRSKFDFSIYSEASSIILLVFIGWLCGPATGPRYQGTKGNPGCIEKEEKHIPLSYI